MKNRIQNSQTAFNYSIAILLASLGFLTTAVAGQSKGSAQLLMPNNPSAHSAAHPGKSKQGKTTCPDCKDVVRQLPDREAKAGQSMLSKGSPTKTTSKHLCEGCSTALAVRGDGRAKQQVASHACAAHNTISASCCEASETKTSSSQAK